MPERHAIRRMFTGVAPRYDLLNRWLSLGIDRHWRRRAVANLGLRPGQRVLDLCCGTGDLALEMSEHASCFACDFVWEMLARARAKARRSSRCLRLAVADALHLPFRSNCFDAAAVAFGVRNLEDAGEGVAELLRVLAPGGTLTILEFSLPPNRLLRRFYQVYLHRLIPWIGDLVSHEKGAYRYLADSIRGFDSPEALAVLLVETGFRDVSFDRLTGGIATIHTGRKPNPV